jgi:hypothetical protein
LPTSKGNPDTVLREGFSGFGAFDCFFEVASFDDVFVRLAFLWLPIGAIVDHVRV